MLVLLRYALFLYFCCCTALVLFAQDSAQGPAPRLNELIADPGTRAKIEDAQNRARFEVLARQWFDMPTKQQLERREAALRKSLKGKIAGINKRDSSMYRNKKRVTPEQNVEIMGWHLAWSGNSYQQYNYDLLTSISYYAYDLNPYTGGYINFGAIDTFKQAALIKRAHQDSCEVLLAVTSFGAENHRAFFEAGLEVRQNLIDSLVHILDTANADGVNIDFQDIPPTYIRDFKAFMSDLSFFLREANPRYRIFLTLSPPRPEPAFSLREFYPYVDRFVLRAYDLHITDENFVKGASAPYNASPAISTPDIGQVVDKYLATADADMAKDIILALPYTGTYWRTTPTDVEYLGQMTYSMIMDEHVSRADASIRYDSLYTTYVCSYPDTTNPLNRYEVYYDSPLSLSEKFDFINRRHLGGVGIWALGYDAGHQELWRSIENKFTEIRIERSNRIMDVVQHQARRYSNILFVSFLFMLIFLSLGFFLSLFDWRVRDMLFRSSAVRLIYLALAVALITRLASYLDLLREDTWTFLWGILLGIMINAVVNNWNYKRRKRMP